MQKIHVEEIPWDKCPLIVKVTIEQGIEKIQKQKTTDRLKEKSETIATGVEQKRIDENKWNGRCWTKNE
jgi:hypothetical protein